MVGGGGSALPPLPPHANLENCQYGEVFGNWNGIKIANIGKCLGIGME